MQPFLSTGAQSRRRARNTQKPGVLSMRISRGIRSVFCCAALVFAQTLIAAPADDIKALVDKGNSSAAYELGKKHPELLGDPSFDFYFGLAAIDSGHAGEG